MQKKLIAIAVAGALGAPAVALAQASTVQVYGQITYEYGILSQGAGQRDTDYADTPSGSAIGIRGEEKLGGGLSAWFQCESSADIRGMDQTGWCTRNSAVGFKGGFGNIHFGKWDTPMKRALHTGYTGSQLTGILGTSFLAFGGAGGADATASGDGPQRQRWSRREAGLTYYESPRFGGFQVLGAFSSGNVAADQAVARLDGTPNAKPRVISFAALYNAGPLAAGLGYEIHKQFGFYAPVSTQNADDKAWGGSVSYKFGPVEVGATYLDAKYETLPGQELKKRTATIGVEWNVAGPHTVMAQYGWAGDSKGNSTVGVAPTANGGLAASGPDTGGDHITIQYNYRFSKRTSVQLGYTRVDNDTNTRSYRVGNAGIPLINGEKTDGAAFLIRHRF